MSTEKPKSRFGLIKEVLKEMTKRRSSFLERVSMFVRFVKLSWSGTTLADMAGVPKQVQQAYAEMFQPNPYNPDEITDQLKEPVLNPVFAFHEALRCGSNHTVKESCKCAEDNPFKHQKISISEAWVFEAHIDQRGKMVKERKKLESLSRGGWPIPSRVRRVTGTDAYLNLVKESESELESVKDRTDKARERHHKKLEALRKMKEDGFVGSDFLTGTTSSQPYDPNQYTEFTPLIGGPFFRQQYMYDMLRTHSLAFEHWNHNPLAKRIIELMTQYAFGRRFDVRIADDTKRQAWEEFDEEFKITKKVSDYWSKEGDIFGEIMINKDTWKILDVSTVWDIITDPDNVDDKYYYYQSYPTAYQMFTGYQVPGEPGAEKQPGSEYVLRQIPAHKIMHYKFNCVSNEKRGRSLLFPILGWLKRVKDLYNAKVIREWLLSSMVWDVTIKGNQADVTAYANQYATMPQPGATEVHNESVTRKPMAAMEGAGQGGSDEIANSLLAFIATAMGIPKEFFNVIASGGGTRATALTGAEPFTKVIENKQSSWENILTDIFKEAMSRKGLKYKKGDVEFIFPGVTKDTTTETLKNLAQAEAMGWISKRTAATMAGKELNITQYDFEDEQETIKQDKSEGFDLSGDPMPPSGRFGGSGAGDGDPGDGSEIHGDGKVDLQDELKTL